MNNLCMLLSLLDDMYINIGCMNGLPPEIAAAALQSVWAKAGEEGKKKECYECKAFAVDLHIAFTINTLTDNPQVHPDHCCHHSMQNGYQCQGRGVRYILLIYFYATSCTIILQVCEHFNVSAKGHARMHTVVRGHQPGLTPDKLHCASFEDCPPTHHWQAKTM